MRNMKWFLWLCLVSVQCVSIANAQIAVDPKLPDYKAKSGVAGKINTVGSDTMNNLAQLWSEEFKKFYPSVSAYVYSLALTHPSSRPQRTTKKRRVLDAAFCIS